MSIQPSSGSSTMSGPPPAVLNQPGYNLYADRGDKVISGMIALIVLASTFVILRLISRHLARAGFWWDDVLMVVATFLAVAPCVCNIFAVRHYGFGKHIYVFTPSDSREAATGVFHTLYFFQIFFTLATGVTKLAILAFYRRIFPIAELKIILITITTVVFVYTIAFTTLMIAQCHPIRKFWENETVLGHCINPTNNLIISGSINTLLDFLIACLPVPLLWRLRTTIRQKIVLTAIFLTAGFVCFVSIVRIVSLTRVDPDDVTWNFVWVAIWSSIEPIVGIFGACLPSLRPLITLLLDNKAYRSITASASRTFQSNTSSSALKSNQSKSRHRDSATFSRLEDHDGDAKVQKLPWRDQKGPRVYDHGADGPNTTVYSGSGRGQGSRGEEDAIEMERTSDAAPPRGAIRVKTEIFLSSSMRLDYNNRLY